MPTYNINPNINFEADDIEAAEDFAKHIQWFVRQQPTLNWEDYWSPEEEE